MTISDMREEMVAVHDHVAYRLLLGIAQGIQANSHPPIDVIPLRWLLGFRHDLPRFHAIQSNGGKGRRKS
jgi:hypothetical protein